MVFCFYALKHAAHMASHIPAYFAKLHSLLSLTAILIKVGSAVTRELERILSRISDRGYKAYKLLLGASARVDGITIIPVRIQPDPFAPPSIFEVQFRLKVPEWALHYHVPLADYLLRKLKPILAKSSLKGIGEGHSGKLDTITPSPIMIWRRALEVLSVSSEECSVTLCARIWVGLPSRRRRILGWEAKRLILQQIPLAFKTLKASISVSELKKHVDAWVEQEYIRSELPKLRLVSFIGDGSILPRRCGGCWEPLDNAVPFESPPSLRVEIELPTERTVTGMGVKEGLTVITGPAFHGKTTLAEAIRDGVWNHIPGDGRELVVTIKETINIESENGRWVSCVDTSSFIKALPGQADPKCLTTADASGATSAAASIQEAVEVGARLLIIDEDNVSSNLIHRDFWVEKAIGKSTIVPVSELARDMASKGISIVIVASGSPHLLASADTVLVMSDYRPLDFTGLKDAFSTVAVCNYQGRYDRPRLRKILGPVKAGRVKVKGRIVFSKMLKHTINLSSLQQLVEEGQFLTALAIALRLVSKIQKPTLIKDAVLEAERRLKMRDLSALGLPQSSPLISEVRALDIAFILNRIPGLKAGHSEAE